METIDYYNKQAEQFIAATFRVDMETLYQPFLDNLPNNAHILDLGCGSGRDTLAFIKKGYNVNAIDYSEALVNKTSELTGINIRHQSFYELDDIDQYDGVWACASLLHCERNRLPDVLKRILNALRRGGVCYMSFKYGSTDREKDGRSFTDLNEVQSKDLLEQFSNVELLKQWVTVDRRPDRDEEWLNILWKKLC